MRERTTQGIGGIFIYNGNRWGSWSARFSFHEGDMEHPSVMGFGWIHSGVELLRADNQEDDSPLKLLWHHPDAIMCCSLKASPVFTFANQAGLDMLETTLVALQDITLDKILDDGGSKALSSEFTKIMQQGLAYLPAGLCSSSMGRPASYEQAITWKVVSNEDSPHCLAFMFVNWTFV